MTWHHIRDEEPTCRSVVHCHLCEGRILYGEKYLRRVGRVGPDGRAQRTDDYIHSFAMHLFCVSLTHDWDEQDWQTHDASDFRELLEMTQ